MKKLITKAVGKIRTMLHDVSLQRYYISILAADYSRLSILNTDRSREPKRLLASGYRFYSQADEDGIIHEIFRRIGVKSKKFIEFGIGDGLENNTAALLFEGWSGLWLEGSKDTVNVLHVKLPKLINSGRLIVKNEFITADNIDALISSSGFSGEIDLISVDIDGNDVHVFERIKCVSPRVVAIEYNAKFPPHVKFTVPYKQDHIWKSSDYMGASLAYITEKMAGMDYCLVGCSMSGANAFFVKKDEVGQHFQEPYTAENHYEPERYFLARVGVTGHMPDYRTLDEASET